jgi:hypothetical protein
MTLENIYYIGQTVAVVAIFGSVVFVGFQIRENSAAVRSATAQAVHDNYGAWCMALGADPEALGASIKGFSDYEGLTPIEKAHFVCTYMAFLSHSQNAFYQWKEGHLSQDMWNAWEALMMNLVNTPGGGAFWRERCYVFGERFQTHVNEIMTRRPDPRARALGVVPVTNMTGESGTDFRP